MNTRHFYKSAVMSAMVLMATVLLPGVVWSSEAGVPLVKKATFEVRSLPTGQAFFLKTRGSHERHGITWLDNHRLMFVAALPAKELESRGIYIWDVIADTVTQYSNHIYFCYAQGYLVAYGDAKLDSTGQVKTVPVRYGQFGSEKDSVCEINSRKGCPPQVANMSCKPWQYSDNRHPIGPKWSTTYELRSGDGVLLTTTDSEAERKSRPDVLLSKRFPEGKPMPFKGVPISGAAYSEFRHRYALTSRIPDGDLSRSSTNWPKGRPQPVYLLNPEDGAVDEIQVPWRAEWTTIHLAMPTRAGLVFMGSGGHSNQWGGLFLYDNREVWALDRGRVETFAVSPDGCRVAYAIINDFGKIKNVRFNNIKSINLCEGGQVNGHH